MVCISKWIQEIAHMSIVGKKTRWCIQFLIQMVVTIIIGSNDNIYNLSEA